METLLYLAITAGFIGLVSRLGTVDAKAVRRKLAGRAIQRIDQLADGSSATVRGTVAVTDPTAQLVSPYTGRACVFWRVVVDEVGAKDFVELGRGEAGVPFLLRSDSGTARVIPDRSSIDLPTSIGRQSVLEEGTILNQLADRFARRPSHTSTTLRLTEYLLEPRAIVTVSGHATHEQDPEGAEDVSGYRSQLPTRPVISGSRLSRLLIGQ